MDRKSERFSPIESPDLNYLASEETSIVGERSPLQQFLAYYVSDCSISTSDETILVARPEGDGSPYFEAGSDGYQLCLLFGVNRLDSLPTTGKRLIIVADVNGTLYFRLFDHRGHLSINTNENDMISINKDDPEETVKQKALKRENLESFKNLNFPPSPPSHEPMVYKQGDIVDEVMTIIGYSRSKEERISPPTALVKETVRRVNDVQKELVNITALGNGWYHFGCRKALPPNAAYVGRARVPGWSCGHRLCPKECYVWVCPEGRKALADFTRSIIKLSGVFKDTQVVTVPSGIQYSPAYSSSPVR